MTEVIVVVVWLFVGAVVTGVWAGVTSEKIDGGSAAIMCMAYPLVLTVLLVAALTRAALRAVSDGK